jgi:phosphoribosylanthranilate isomerase
MTRVKICGINSPAAFDTCADLAVEWVGFNFFPPSPRYVTAELAAALSARCDGGPKRVGLFVKPTDAEIAAALMVLPLDVLQIYDDPRRITALRQRFGIEVWRAVGVRSRSDLPSPQDDADGFVIEAPPVAGGLPGGNGLVFDWSTLKGWQAPKPWLLAGGLTGANVQQAIHETGALAVDVSSGVETSPGCKAPDLMRAFVSAAQEPLKSNT